VLSLVDGIRTADIVVEEADGVEPDEVLYYRLLQLEKHNILEEAGKPDSPAATLNDIMNGGELPDVEPSIPGGRVRLVFLGSTARNVISRSLKNAGLTLLDGTKWRERVNDSADELWLVAVDDYLEPDIEEFNQLAVDYRRRWILFKPVGIRILIGPYFDTPGTPCWNCLAVMLRGHRYAESMINRRNITFEPLRLSCGWSDASMAIAASLLTRELQKHTPAGISEILSINLADHSREKHILRKLDRCSVCSVSSPEESILPLKQLELHPAHKYLQSENGSRIRSSSETLQYLQNYVSSISGVIGSVVEFHPEITVYGRQFQAAYPAARTVECFRRDKADRFGVTQGKGITGDQARVSAMAEAAERYCARFRTSDRTFIAAASDFGFEMLPPDEMVLLSDSQRRDFSDISRKRNLDDPFMASTPIDWSPAWSLTQRKWKLVPSFTVYYPFPSDRKYMVPGWTTNGLSAGSCLEEAILQGLLELIERDAISIWWYNRFKPNGFDIDSFNRSQVSLLAERMKDAGWDMHILDLSTDLAVPVIAALGINRTDPDRDPIFGFGANLDPAVALTRALGEMTGEWKSAPNIFSMNINAVRFLGTHANRLDFFHPSMPLQDVSKTAVRSSNYLTEDIDTLVEILKEKGMETLVVDMSRGEAPLKTVRVIATGMRQVLPHFGSGRIFGVPVITGHLSFPLNENEMNPMPFWHLLNRVNPVF
jgi:ribosomal protein S12 methylthiotransferase accessory factor